MLKRESYLRHIKERLGWLCSYVKLENGNLRYDINHAAETFYAELLNIIYGYRLINGNDNEKNLTAIDLVDKENHLAIQVTSDRSSTKVKETLKKFKEKNYASEYDRIIILVITEKLPHNRAYKTLPDAGVPFDSDNDIWDCKTIIDELSKTDFPLKRLEEIKIFLESNISVPSSTDKQDILPNVLTQNSPAKITLVGRIDIRANLYEHAKNEHFTILHADGGIGKTALATDLFYRLKDEECHVGWITCGANLLDDILQLTIGPENEDSQTRRNHILHWLSSKQKDVFLFLDNMDRKLTREDKNLMHRIDSTIKVIITTRQGYEGLGLTPKDMIDVPPLKKDEARDLFYCCYAFDRGRKKLRIVDSIILFAEKNTLLIELLARAARAEGGPLEEFEKKMKSIPLQNVSLAALETSHLEKYEDKVEELTIMQELLRLYSVIGMGNEEFRILRLFTIMPANTEIWYKIREWAGLSINAMQRLVNLGWLRQSEFGYEIHGIIKRCLEIQWETAGLPQVRVDEYTGLIENVLLSSMDFDPMIDYKEIHRRLLVPVALVENIFGNKEQYNKNAIALCFVPANVYVEVGESNKGLKYYKCALVIAKELFEERSLVIGMIYANIGVAYSKMGNHSKSLEYKEKALTIQKEMLPENHQKLAESYSNIGVTYGDSGDFCRALEFKERARDIFEEILPANHPELAKCYNGLGVAWQDMGDVEKALEYYEKAVQILEKNKSEYWFELSMSYDNIGNIYDEMNELEKALAYKKKGLLLRCEKLPANHPVLAGSYNNIGNTYDNLGDFDKAKNYYIKAVRINKDLFERKPDLAGNYYNLSKVLVKQGELEDAIKYIKKALDIWKAAPPRDKTNVEKAEELLDALLGRST